MPKIVRKAVQRRCFKFEYNMFLHKQKKPRTTQPEESENIQEQSMTVISHEAVQEVFIKGSNQMLQVSYCL